MQVLSENAQKGRGVGSEEGAHANEIFVAVTYDTIDARPFTPPFKNQMYAKGKNVMGKSLRLEIEEMWSPLREIQAEDAAIKKANEEAGLGSEYARCGRLSGRLAGRCCLRLRSCRGSR